MGKTSTIRARIEPDLKSRLEQYPGPLTATVRVAVLEYLTKDRSLGRRTHALLYEVRPYINAGTPRGEAMLERVNEILEEME